MNDAVANFWTDKTSVLFTSYWGWTPDTWGTLGFTGDNGLAHRNNLLKQLSDPFIAAVYVTSSTTYGDPALKGMIAGFYLITHETGDRNDFTHPIHHTRFPDKWKHSLRACRAFSYLPEYRISVAELDPALLDRARNVAAMGEVLTNPQKIQLLRETPWIEVDVYTPAAYASSSAGASPGNGLVKAGPRNKGGYVVAESTDELSWQLYILRLVGDTDAYLGNSAGGRSIYKIGLSVSPDLRRQAFEKAMPRGSFHWQLERTTKLASHSCFSAFDTAVAGEDAMKQHLAGCTEWLGGEFYLATAAQIDEAWHLGHGVAILSGQKT